MTTHRIGAHTHLPMLRKHTLTEHRVHVPPSHDSHNSQSTTTIRHIIMLLCGRALLPTAQEINRHRQPTNESRASRIQSFSFTLTVKRVGRARAPLCRESKQRSTHTRTRTCVGDNNHNRRPRIPTKHIAATPLEHCKHVPTCCRRDAPNSASQSLQYFLLFVGV